MTRNAETPDTPVADGSRSAAEATPSAGVRTTQNGPVAELGLVAAGLGLVIYLIAFVADFGGSTSLVLPLLLGGGLLAGTVALPSVGSPGARARRRRHHHRSAAPAACGGRRRQRPRGRRTGARPARGRSHRRRHADAGGRAAVASVEEPQGTRVLGVLRVSRGPAVPRAAVPGPALPGHLPRRRPGGGRSPATSGRASTPTPRTPSTGSSTACPATRRHRRTGPPATTPPCTARRPRRSPSEPRRPIRHRVAAAGHPPRDRAGRRSGSRFRVPVRR